MTGAWEPSFGHGTDHPHRPERQSSKRATSFLDLATRGAIHSVVRSHPVSLPRQPQQVARFFLNVFAWRQRIGDFLVEKGAEVLA